MVILITNSCTPLHFLLLLILLLTTINCQSTSQPRQCKSPSDCGVDRKCWNCNSLVQGGPTVCSPRYTKGSCIPCDDNKQETILETCQPDGECKGMVVPFVRCTSDSACSNVFDMVRSRWTGAALQIQPWYDVRCIVGKCIRQEASGHMMCAMMPNVGAPCDDLDPNTVNDRCRYNGTCTGTRRGSKFDDGVCGDVTTCTIDSDCSGSIRVPATAECLVAKCTEQVCSIGFSEVGTPCALYPNGWCDGNGTCTECSVDTDCPDSSVDCRYATCSKGRCVDRISEPGSVCQDGGGVCDSSGSCRDCNSDSDCTDRYGDAPECSKRVCANNKCGLSDVVGSVCASGVCAPGRKCVECISSSDCGGSSQNSVCEVRECRLNNTCGDAYAPARTKCGTRSICDGKGACVGCLDVRDCPYSTNATRPATILTGPLGIGVTTATKPHFVNGDPLLHPCIATACVGGTCIEGVLGGGEQCGYDYAPEACRPDGTCRWCNGDSDCATVAVVVGCGRYFGCNRSTGVCSSKYVEEGTSCQNGYNSRTCDGHGGCYECNVASDCINTVDQNSCSATGCINHKCGVINKPVGSTCQYGKCDANGACRCTSNSDCPLSLILDSSYCIEMGCLSSGDCGVVAKPAGTMCTRITQGISPRQYESACDGHGVCLECNDNLDCPMDTNPLDCVVPKCDANGVCGTVNKPKDTPCSGDQLHFCDDKGNCQSAGHKNATI